MRFGSVIVPHVRPVVAPLFFTTSVIAINFARLKLVAHVGTGVGVGAVAVAIGGVGVASDPGVKAAGLPTSRISPSSRTVWLSVHTSAIAASIQKLRARISGCPARRSATLS